MNGDGNSTQLLWPLGDLNELRHVQPLEQDALNTCWPPLSSTWLVSHSHVVCGLQGKGPEPAVPSSSWPSSAADLPGDT